MAKVFGLKRPNVAQARRRKLRDELWPDADDRVWNRLEEDGFCTVPGACP